MMHAARHVSRQILLVVAQRAERAVGMRLVGILSMLVERDQGDREVFGKVHCERWSDIEQSVLIQQVGWFFDLFLQAP
jgi:hypothetical protein